MPTEQMLASLLDSVWCQQAPKALLKVIRPRWTAAPTTKDEALPAAIDSRDSLLELVRWGLANEDDYLVRRAIDVAGWLQEDPGVRAALQTLVEDPELGLSACVALRGDVKGWAPLADEEDDAEEMSPLVNLCMDRTDPGAMAALVRAYGDEYRGVDVVAEHLIQWADLGDLIDPPGGELEEALMQRLPLRDDIDVLDRCWEVIESENVFRAPGLLMGLSRRADPACLEGLLRRWRFLDCDDEACGAVDRITLARGGRAALRRLVRDAAPLVALLARIFLFRAAPTPKEFEALTRLLEARAHTDDYDLAFGPLHDFAWSDFVPPATTRPAERIRRSRPAFLDLPRRKRGTPRLVEPKKPAERGWVWLRRPARARGEGWESARVLATLGPLRVRWGGDLVDAGHDDLLGDMSTLAAFDGDDGVPAFPSEPFEDAEGRVSPAWARALLAASHALERRHDGPAEEWLGWLCFELSEPRDALATRARG